MNLAIDKFPKKRLGLVTGSRCSVMFPLRGDGVVGMSTYAKQLAYQRFFGFYDEVSSWQTEHGNMAESFAFEHYKTYFSADIEEGRFIVEGECGGSTDAETPTKIVDFKCPTSLAKWLDYLYTILDKDQYHQLQMYMYLTGKKEAQIAAYLTETQFMNDTGIQYPVPEEKRMIIVDVKKEHGWEDRLNAQLPFIVQLRDNFIEKLNKQFND